MNADFIDLQDISGNSQREVLTFLSDYPKFKSVAVMASVSLPVSKAVIIVRQNLKTKIAVDGILDRWNVKEYVIRTDRKTGAVNAPSIQNCLRENLWPHIRKFLKGGLLPMIIAEGDVFHNTYSMNIKIDPDSHGKYYLEIVGPGFCATDLNKRDIVQERGYLTKQVKLIDQRIVGQKAYQNQIRILKESIVRKEADKGNVFENKKEAIRWTEVYLKNIGALILDNPKYKEISPEYLKRVWNFIPQIRKACELMGYKNESSIVSMSFVSEKGREYPFFWDIHPYMGYTGNKLQP